MIKLSTVIGRLLRGGGSADLPHPEASAERRDLARMSRKATRGARVFEPVRDTYRLVGITTDDVDPSTGRVFADYLERRRLRAEAEGKDEPVLFGCVRHDVHPDH